MKPQHFTPNHPAPHGCRDLSAPMLATISTLAWQGKHPRITRQAPSHITISALAESTKHPCRQVSAPSHTKASTGAERSLRGCRSSQAPSHNKPSTLAYHDQHPRRAEQAPMQRRRCEGAKRARHPHPNSFTALAQLKLKQNPCIASNYVHNGIVLKDNNWVASSSCIRAGCLV